jgi:hypothetical protein
MEIKMILVSEISEAVVVRVTVEVSAVKALAIK